jgi:hypothetical protein
MFAPASVPLDEQIRHDRVTSGRALMPMSAHAGVRLSGEWLALWCARPRLRLVVPMFWSAGPANDMLNIVDGEAAAVVTRVSRSTTRSGRRPRPGRLGAAARRA